MKKFLIMLLLFQIIPAIHAKEVDLPIIETEWGYKISLRNKKGKKISNNDLTLVCNTKPKGILFILKRESDIFSIEKGAEAFLKVSDYQSSSFEVIGLDQRFGQYNALTSPHSFSFSNIPIMRSDLLDEIFIVFIEGTIPSLKVTFIKKNKTNQSDEVHLIFDGNSSRPLSNQVTELITIPYSEIKKNKLI